ncbi:MAG: hypothetical protein JNJ57_00990, partial [Saprospiraceae bacterium]|nr:hypothetical protein [Saprospiraceae bacterium]
MKTYLYLFASVLLSALFSCKSNGLSFKERSKKNVETRHQSDSIAQITVKRKHRENTIAGWKIGKDNAAPARGSELAVADFHDQYPNETYLFFVEPYVSFLPNGRIRINHKKINEDFGAKGYIEAYEDGITQGEMDAMNYFGSLTCQKNQYVSKPRPLLRPLYHYDTIAQILGKRYPEGMMDQGSFDFICRHTLTESLEFLNRNLLPYGLTWDEKMTTMDFFNTQIIDQACQSLYGLYQKKMKPLLERNEEPEEGPFYDYSTYYSSTVFLNLMSQWMSGVADYALSYGKGNSEFAGTMGFFMQEIGETLIAEIAPQFQDIIFKNALIYHFDHTRDSVQTMVRNMAAGVSIETRKEKKEVL